MKNCINRVHIFGASGSGTTTFGRALADKYGFAFFDTDDYFWKVKYSEINRISDRIEMIQKATRNEGKWVLSGSLCGWGDVSIPSFDIAVFIYLPKEIRMARLKEREKERYGDDILPGGPRHSEYIALIEWAGKYDEGGREIRSKLGHEEWIEKLTCPVLRFDGDFSIEGKMKKYEEFKGISEI